MKLNGFITAGTWTNWLGFKLDPDYSPDPGTGFFLNFSGISEEVVDGFR